MLPLGMARGCPAVLNRAGSSSWVPAPASRTGLGHSWLWVYQGLQGPGVSKAWLGGFQSLEDLGGSQPGDSWVECPHDAPWWR